MVTFVMPPDTNSSRRLGDLLIEPHETLEIELKEWLDIVNDGAHKAVGLRPMMFKAEKAEKVWLCGCKATAGKPFCDGTHSKI